MADYIGLCRSNYVRPKNRDEFVAFLKTFVGIRIVEKDDRVGFCNDDSGLPFRNCDDDERNMIDCSEEIGAMLEDDEVMVVMEIGNEKLRYLNGYAWAMHSSGRSINVSIDEIYELASLDFQVDIKSITECSY